MERAIVTGATGTIGIALIQKLVKEQVEVLVICHKNSSRIQNVPIHPMVTVIQADLADYISLYTGNDTCIQRKKYDVFYHLAWNGTFGETRNDMSLQVQNIQFTLDAVDLAERLGCHTFVGTGSQAEYGRVEGILTPTTSVNPENGYGMAKLCASQMSRQVCERKGMKHIWTRILSVYGPFDGEQTMIMSILRKMQRNEPIALTKGEQIWDYLYSEDAANALYLLGEKGKSGKTYCLGSGEGRPLREYIEIMKEVVGSESVLNFGEIPYGEKQVMWLQADIEELVKQVNFTVRVDFESGIKMLGDRITKIEKISNKSWKRSR